MCGGLRKYDTYAIDFLIRFLGGFGDWPVENGAESARAGVPYSIWHTIVVEIQTRCA